MKLSIQQQIINFIDCNHGATFNQVSKEFKACPVYLAAFDELLADGQLRQVAADKNLGTYKYQLPA